MLPLPDCAIEITQHYEVPVVIVAAVRTQERGRVGQVVGPNSNGTYDIGPMQINTFWWSDKSNIRLDQFGISPEEVRDNECTNIAVGAWVLRMNYNRYGNWYEAVAAYNAGTPNSIGKKYADLVFAHVPTTTQKVSFTRENT